MTQKRKKINRRKTSRLAPEPYAAQIIDAWKAHKLVEEGMADIDFNQLSPELEQLRERYVDSAARFDTLIERAWESGRFGRTMACIAELAGKHIQTGQISTRFFLEMMDGMSNAHQSRVHWGKDTNQHTATLRTVVFGIPLSGSLEGVLDLSEPDVAEMVRSTGWAPTEANVACLGVMTASDAMALSQDPAVIWGMCDALHKTQGSSIGGVHIPGLKQQAGEIAPDPDPDPDVIMTGGYVLLMSVFCGGQEECAAVDFPDDPDNMETKWEKACSGLLKNIEGVAYIGVPQSLDEAGREAIVQQLMLTMGLARAQETEEGDDAACVEVAFVVNAIEEKIDMVGHFSDGSQTRVPGALQHEAILLLDDIVRRLSREGVVSVVMAGGPLPWQTDEFLELDEDMTVERRSNKRCRTLH
jgi:hypothetical protein